MKVLYITTIGSTMEFFQSFIRTLLDEGHIVDIVTNDSERKVPECYDQWGCKIFSISCSRSPLNTGNIKAITQIRKIVEEEQYDIVHCHTPIAAACTRIACRKLRRKQGVRVIYTAHGFHFYKGAPLKNWLIYYPVENLCARWTDVLITINTEDYECAMKRLRVEQTVHVPGVGVDIDRFGNAAVDRIQMRKKLGIPEEAFLMVSVGELNKNKNHEIILRAMAELKNKTIYYVIAGVGPLDGYLKEIAQNLGLGDRVQLLGYRNDVADIYHSADIFCFPSIREGLPVSLIEAMACGLPAVTADNRGTREIVRHGKTGYLCRYNAVDEFAKGISKMLNTELRKRLACNCTESVRKFDISKAGEAVMKVYFS